MRADPTTFEIIRHKFFRVIDEAIIALKNVSGSPITNEGHDLMVSLYRPDGGLLIGGVGFLHHLTSASQACKHILSAYSTDPGIFEEDIFLLNDPYTAALHNPDVYLVAPIYHKGQLAAWTANFVHVTDVGAVNAGGFSPRATECFHEGFSSRGIKLVERGHIRRDVFETILNMVRDPGMVALDLRSQIAACNVARKRMQDLLDRYERPVVDEVAQELLDQSERLLRDRLLELPDGVWRARQYIDAPDRVYTVTLAMTKRRDALTYDLTGSSPQSPLGINCTYWATWGAMFAPIFPLLCYDITWNDGVTRPIRLVAPEGTIVNCRRPAPISLATVQAIQITNNLSTLTLSKMLGASTKYRNESTAVWHGSHAHIELAGVNQAGDFFIAPLTDTFGGSGGGRAFRDGVDVGGEIPNVISRWANVETHELNTPVMYLFRRRVRDSAGPGKQRGGVCHEYAITPHDAPEGQVHFTLFGKGVKAPHSYGLFGGYPGCNVDYAIFHGVSSQAGPALLDGEDALGDRVEHVMFGDFVLAKNEVLYIRFMGGGGYGDPLDRDPTLVMQDVAEGLVCSACAMDVYGVSGTADGRSVDKAATESLRTKIHQQRLHGRRLGPAPGTPREPDGVIRVSEYLWIREDSAGKVVCCAKCGHELCEASVRWKEHAVMREVPLTAAGHLRSRSDLFHLTEYFCPGCATTLEVEVLQKGDAPLHDELQLSGRA